MAAEAGPAALLAFLLVSDDTRVGAGSVPQRAGELSSAEYTATSVYTSGADDPSASQLLFDLAGSGPSWILAGLDETHWKLPD